MKIKRTTKFLIFAMIVSFSICSFLPVGRVEAQSEEQQSLRQVILQQILELQQRIQELQQELAIMTGGSPQIVSFTKKLYRGVRDKEVEKLQELLSNDTEIYPEGLVTGYFGELTAKAVKKFQEKYADELLAPLGLTEGTGYVGEKTILKLNALSQIAVPATPAAPGEGVATPAAPAEPATSSTAVTTTTPDTTTTTAATTDSTSNTTVLVISNVAAGNIGTTYADVSWDTNEASDGAVEYGTSTVYGSVASTTGTATSHTASLAQLIAETTYHYRVKSSDDAGNQVYSEDNTFVTLAESPSSVSSIQSGSGVIAHASPYYFTIGTGMIGYKVALEGETGYIYSSQGTSPTLHFGDPTDLSTCSEYASVSGYQGISNICDFTSADNHNFDLPYAVMFGDKNSDCYKGIMLFRQNALYGALEFVDVDSSKNLHYNYWYDESGGSDFSSLCETSSLKDIEVQVASIVDFINQIELGIKALLKPPARN